MELKPFHESIMDSVELCVKRFQEESGLLKSPYPEFTAKPIISLIEYFDIVFGLIRISIIPKDKIEALSSFIKNREGLIIKEIESSSHSHASLTLRLKQLFRDVCQNLDER